MKTIEVHLPNEKDPAGQMVFRAECCMVIYSLRTGKMAVHLRDCSTSSATDSAWMQIVSAIKSFVSSMPSSFAASSELYSSEARGMRASHILRDARDSSSGGALINSVVPEGPMTENHTGGALKARDASSALNNAPSFSFNGYNFVIVGEEGEKNKIISAGVEA